MLPTFTPAMAHLVPDVHAGCAGEIRGDGGGREKRTGCDECASGDEQGDEQRRHHDATRHRDSPGIPLRGSGS